MLCVRQTLCHSKLVQNCQLEMPTRPTGPTKVFDHLEMRLKNIFSFTSSTFKQNGCSTHRKILKALNTKHLSPIVFRYDMSSYNQKHFSSCRIKTNVSECSIMFYQHPCAPTHHVRCPKSNCQKWIALQSGIMDSQQNPHHATPSASTIPRFAWTLRAQDCLHLMEAQTGTLCF